METGFLPFALVPLLIYTYFWVNPMSLAVFLEGVNRYLVEIYLGYKEWKIEYETKKAYKYYVRMSERLAKESGLPSQTVKLYFKTYGQDDWRALRQQNQESHEERHKDLEDSMRDMLLY